MTRSRILAPLCVLALPLHAAAQGSPERQQGTPEARTQQQQTPQEQRQPPGGAERKQTQRASPGQLLDVEELNDSIERHVGKQVRVAGEIEERFGIGTFVLESGGLFNDEIPVVVPNRVLEQSNVALTDDADIVVTGTVRRLTVVEVERELGWDLDPTIEVELEGTQYYLVADRVEYQRR